MLRQEYKFFIKSEDIYLIKNQLAFILLLDNNCKNFIPYTITSVYFDTPEDDELFDKLNGVRFREKYRLRFYNERKNKAKFEVKRKKENLIEKLSIEINQFDFTKLLEGDFTCLKKYQELEYISYKMKYKLYKPKAVVRYDRLAFRLPINNIRVTLDLNLRSSGLFSTYIEHDIKAGLRLMPVGHDILEVKYSDNIPDFLHSILSSYSLKRSSISKYVSSRLFNNANLNNDNPILPL